MSVFYDLNKTPRNILNQAIVRAIISENNGVLFDPSDLSTLYQDAAGTTPVTAVEQPVGKMLDKSGNGYHATQSITASRPTLSARYNLLTKTEDFSDAAWIGGGDGQLTTISDYATDPFGGTAADTIYGTFITAGRQKYQAAAIPNTPMLLSIWMKAPNGNKSIGLFINDSQITQSINVTNQWVRYTLSGTVGGSLIGSGRCGFKNLETLLAGDLLIFGADIRIGTTSRPYQRVNTATDYDTDERYFPKYLRGDAVDDFMNLPFMNLYGGGAASIVCARDAVSQTTDTYIISERSTTDADPKYFPSRQLASAGNMDAYITDDAGAVVLDTVGSPFSGVANAVIRSIVDSGNNLKLFKNGVLAANDNYTRSGTLTLNNTTIGASVSTTTGNYASMKLYGLIVTKSALTDAQRVTCERYLGRKSGVQL